VRAVAVPKATPMLHRPSGAFRARKSAADHVIGPAGRHADQPARALPKEYALTVEADAPLRGQS